MTVTETPTTDSGPHPVDNLHRLLVEIINRMPWHSEDQHQSALNLLRDSEAALKGDAADSSPSVIPPAPVAPVPADTFGAAVAASGQPIDYAALAAAIVDAQAKLDASKATQAAPPVSDTPADTPPAV